MMQMTELGHGLERFLSEAWHETVDVENLRVASAGARRHNVLFRAVSGSGCRDLVVTVNPTDAIEICDVNVEAATLRFVESAQLPAPRIVAVCSDPSVLGGPFFVTTLINGDSIPRRVLRLVEADSWLGERLAEQCGQFLAKLHRADVGGVHSETGRPEESSAVTALSSLKDKLLTLRQPFPSFTLALRWLATHLPPKPRQIAFLHGDFRTGNIAVDEEGLVAAFDWELAHIGDPMEDLAHLCVRSWRFLNDTLEVGGFGSRASLLAGYEEAGGEFDRVSFCWWKLFRTVWWGIGLAGQVSDHLDGSFPSIVMAASGCRVAELEYDTLMLLRRNYEGVS